MANGEVGSNLPLTVTCTVGNSDTLTTLPVNGLPNITTDGGGRVMVEYLVPGMAKVLNFKVRLLKG